MVCVHLKLEWFLSKIYAVFILIIYNDFLINSGLHVTTVRPVHKLDVAGFRAAWNTQV